MRNRKNCVQKHFFDTLPKENGTVTKSLNLLPEKQREENV